MISENTELALSYFVEGSKDRYRQVFTELGTEINNRFAEITGFEIYTVDDHTAQCGAVRVETGGIYAYPVTFIKDENGIWKVMGF